MCWDWQKEHRHWGLSKVLGGGIDGEFEIHGVDFCGLEIIKGKGHQVRWIESWDAGLIAVPSMVSNSEYLSLESKIQSGIS